MAHIEGVPLRTLPEHEVWIGGHRAPSPEKMLPQLDALLAKVNEGSIEPWAAHCEYEMLHPFMDGNGRSGRALWAWMMKGRGYDFSLKFLHMFYYNTLQAYYSTWGGRK